MVRCNLLLMLFTRLFTSIMQHIEYQETVATRLADEYTCMPWGPITLQANAEKIWGRSKSKLFFFHSRARQFRHLEMLARA